MSRWDNYSDDRKKELNKVASDYVKNNYDRIHFNVPSGTRQRWLKEAEERGFKGLAPFIRHCVETVINSNDSTLAESYKNDILSDN